MKINYGVLFLFIRVYVSRIYYFLDYLNLRNPYFLSLKIGQVSTTSFKSHLSLRFEEKSQEKIIEFSKKRGKRNGFKIVFVSPNTWKYLLLHIWKLTRRKRTRNCKSIISRTVPD